MVVHPKSTEKPGPLTHCIPDEANKVGDVKQDCGSVRVDIFQRVGTIDVGSLSPRFSVQETVAWPEQSDLCIQIEVLDQDDRPIQAESFDRQQVPFNKPPRLPFGSFGKGLPLPDAKEEVDVSGQDVADTYVEALAAMALSYGGSLQDSTELLKPRETTEDTKSPANFVDPLKPLQSARDKSPDALSSEVVNKPYKPIMLNNCDQIIPNLYLGGVEAVTDSQRVSSQGIKAICCCLRDMEYPSSEFCKDVEYYRVDVEDMGREPIEAFFEEATEFIHSWTSREQPVLVHCRAGVSRSASVVIAYLMTYQGYSLYDAFFLVRSHRSVATPNIGFMEKLCDYEEKQEQLALSPTIDMNKYESWYTSAERGAVPDLIPD